MTISEQMIERALDAMNKGLIDARHPYHESDKALMRQALEAALQPDADVAGLVAECRVAFDDANVWLKNIALRKCHDALTRLSAELAEVKAEREEARKLAFAPGVWKCAKCNFRLVQSNLNAIDGTVTARDTPGDKCPNCDSPLWRVSWKDEAMENLDIGEQQVARATAAEAERDRLRKALGRLFHLCEAGGDPFEEPNRAVVNECRAALGEKADG